jgi:hypothetical protein
MASQESTLRLSRESRRIAGLLLLSLVAVESGGYYLTRVVSGTQEVTDFQTAFARAGHAHAAVLIILALVGVILADAARLTGVFGYVARLAIPLAAILMPVGFFLSSTGTGTTEPNGMIVLLWLGAVALTVGLVSLGGALLRSSLVPEPDDDGDHAAPSASAVLREQHR